MPPHRRHILRCLALASALAPSAACHRAPETTGTPVDADTRARFAREGEEALRKLGTGQFEVLAFRPGEVKPLVFVDDFNFHSRYQALDADCQLKWLRDVTVPSKGDLIHRQGAPDWTMEESEDGIERMSALGDGLHKAGAVENRSLAAVFADLEPGFRYAGLDHTR